MPLVSNLLDAEELRGRLRAARGAFVLTAAGELLPLLGG
jgi:hypothetical protein